MHSQTKRIGITNIRNEQAEYTASDENEHTTGSATTVTDPRNLLRQTEDGIPSRVVKQNGNNFCVTFDSLNRKRTLRQTSPNEKSKKSKLLSPSSPYS